MYREFIGLLSLSVLWGLIVFIPDHFLCFYAPAIKDAGEVVILVVCTLLSVCTYICS